MGEEASQVGLGWALNAGGVISRNIINQDDFAEDVTAYLNQYNNAPITATDEFSMTILRPLQSGVKAKFVNLADAGNPTVYNLEEYIDGQSVDFDPDQFTYNFLGQSGKFIMKRFGSPHRLEAVLEKKDKISLEPTPTGTSWTVKTADGATYLFNKPEAYRSDGEGEVEHISAWYLTEITSPTGARVYFEYTIVPNQFIKPVGVFSEVQQAWKASCATFICEDYVPAGPGTYAPGKSYKNVRLDRIIWDNGKVEFEMGDRIDVMGDKKVDFIKIYAKDLVSGSYLLKDVYEFGYTYLSDITFSPGFPAVDPDINNDRLTKRLKLVSLTRKSPENNRTEYKHLFQYYEGTSSYDRLPAKNSYSRDHWGYYNGSGKSSFLPSYQHVAMITNLEMIDGIMGPEREPSALHMKAGSLKSITYPTGGRTEFEYGINDYDVVLNPPPMPEQEEAYPEYEAFSQSAGEASVMKELDIRDEYQDPNNSSTIPVKLSGSFSTNLGSCSIPGAPEVYIQILSENGVTEHKRVSVNISPCAVPGDIDCLQCNGGSSSYHVFSFVAFVVLPPGIYQWKAIINHADFTTASTQIEWWVDPEKRPRSITGDPNVKYSLAGGLRIEKIKDFDPESEKASNIRTFSYHTVTDTAVYSNGIRMIAPRYSYNEIAWEKKIIGMEDEEGNPSEQAAICLDCLYIIRQSDSFLPATGSMGSIVGYGKVTETQGEVGENGYTVYEYYNVQDIVTPFRYELNEAYHMRPPAVSTKADPLNGMLLSQTNYGANDKKVHRVEHQLNEKFRRWEYGIEVRQVRVIGMGAQDAATLLLGQYPNILKPYFQLYIYPAMASTFPYVKNTREIFYDNNEAEKLSTFSEFFYDNAGHLQMTRSTSQRSNQNVLETTYKYPADYTTGADAAITEMKGDKFMHGVPIETRVFDLTAGKVISHNISLFGLVNGLVLPISAAALNVPLAPTTVPVYVPSSGYNQGLYRKGYTIGYNTNGTVKTVQKEKDVISCYIWGVRQSFPIAEVVNAQAEEVYLQNFEDGGAGSPLKPHTGRRYHSGDFTVDFTTPNSRTYAIEYWYYDDSKWNHKVMDYTTATTLTDGTAIDDVRIYPKDAMMKSFTYDPFGEMTSSISENGQVKIMEYDTFSRLVRVRNAKGEIEKQYTYHYKEQ